MSSASNTSGHDEPRRTLTNADVARVAALCKLELSTAQASDQREQLTRIIDYVEQIRRLDLSGIEPLTRVTEEVNRFATPLPAMIDDEAPIDSHAGPLPQDATADRWPAVFETAAPPAPPHDEDGHNDTRTHRYIRVPKIIGDG